MTYGTKQFFINIDCELLITFYISPAVIHPVFKKLQLYQAWDFQCEIWIQATSLVLLFNTIIKIEMFYFFVTIATENKILFVLTGAQQHIHYIYFKYPQNNENPQTAKLVVKSEFT